MTPKYSFFHTDNVFFCQDEILALKKYLNNRGLDISYGDGRIQGDTDKTQFQKLFATTRPSRAPLRAYPSRA